MQTTGNLNTPAIVEAAGTALEANTARVGWVIQNVDTHPLFVRLGADCTTSVFHFVLKGGTGNDDGTGGSFSQTEGVIYTGIVTVEGTTPRFTVTEIKP